MQDKFYGMLGICAKAGKTTSGAVAVREAVKSGKAALVIIAEDASENTKTDYEKLCSANTVPYKIFGKTDDLGRSTGKGSRAAIVITDKRLAESLIKKMSL